MTESITFIITYKEVPSMTRLVLVDDEAHAFIEDDYAASDVCGLVRRFINDLYGHDCVKNVVIDEEADNE